MKALDKLPVMLCVLSVLAACDGGSGGRGNDDGQPATGDTGTTLPPSAAPKVWINEVMAQNRATWPDETGYFPDWLELYNPNDEAVDISGWWLTDDVDDPFDWQVPDGVSVPAHGYLVVFCDDDDIDGDLHASFHIASLGGEDVALFGPNVLDNPRVDSVENMTVQDPDVSLARCPDGGPTLDKDPTASPAAPNNCDN